MKKTIKKLISVLYRYKQVISWEREAKAEKNRIQHDCEISQKIKGRCLILIPHSDDEWIGCSRIIQSENEVVLCNMDMSGNDMESLHNERREEMTRVANFFNRDFITIEENKSENLYETIRKVKPDFIFLPHFIDWHPEHIAVMHYLSKAIDLLETSEMYFQVVTYQVSCPVVRGITHALPMSKEEWIYKWDFFKYHYPSQIQIPFQRFSINEKISGQFVGSFAAEVFCMFRIDEWNNLMQNCIPSQEQIIALKNNLGSISSMREYIRKEFN